MSRLPKRSKPAPSGIKNTRKRSFPKIQEKRNLPTKSYCHVCKRREGFLKMETPRGVTLIDPNSALFYCSNCLHLKVIHFEKGE